MQNFFNDSSSFALTKYRIYFTLIKLSDTFGGGGWNKGGEEAAVPSFLTEFSLIIHSVGEKLSHLSAEMFPAAAVMA